MQVHLELFQKFPDIALVQSPSVWLEKGYPYPNLGIEIPSGAMPIMVGNMVPMVGFSFNSIYSFEDNPISISF